MKLYIQIVLKVFVQITKSTNYINTPKSICNDTIKNKFTYVDSAKSACNDKIKSTIVNINYIDVLIV